MRFAPFLRSQGRVDKENLYICVYYKAMTLQLIIVYFIGLASITWIARRIYRKIQCKDKSICDECSDSSCPHHMSNNKAKGPTK